MTTASEPITATTPPEPADAPPTPPPAAAPVADDVDTAESAVLALEPAPQAAPPSPEPEPAAAPEPAAVEQPAEPATDDPEVAWTHPEGWKYDWLEYRGDRLAVRIPNKSAIHAMQNLRHSSAEFQQDLFHRFMRNHVSADSYRRVNDRMVDPDDTDYADAIDQDPLYGLLSVLLQLGRERIEAEQKALQEVTS